MGVPVILSLLAPVLLLASSQDALTPSAKAQSRAPDYWERVAEELKAHRSVEQVLAPDRATQRMRETLRSSVLPSLHVEDEESLTEIASLMQTMTGIPILVDREAEEAVLDEGLVFSLNLTNPTSLESALNLLGGMTAGQVTWTLRNEAVLLTVPWHAKDATIFLHPIADLTTIFDADQIAYLVSDNVHQGSWENGDVSIEVSGAFLTVIHDRQVQLETEAFLGNLRHFVQTLDSPPDFSPRITVTTSPTEYMRLERVRFTPQFEHAPIHSVAAFFQELTGLNVVVSRQVAEELDEEATLVSLNLPEMSVRSCLDLMTDVQSQLSWTVRDGILHIVTAEEARPAPILALYDVRAIVGPAPPECVLPDDFGEGDEVYESLVVGADFLDSLIRNAIDPESWDQDPRNSIRVTQSGILVVNQSSANQSRIRELLSDLQAIADVMLGARDAKHR